MHLERGLADEAAEDAVEVERGEAGALAEGGAVEGLVERDVNGCHGPEDQLAVVVLRVGLHVEERSDTGGNLVGFEISLRAGASGCCPGPGRLAGAPTLQGSRTGRRPIMRWPRKEGQAAERAVVRSSKASTKKLPPRTTR